jgi:hypothetical protein
MDKIYKILNSLTEVAKTIKDTQATILPVPTIEVPPAEPKPIIKPELVDEKNNTKTEKEANDKLQELRPSNPSAIVPTTADSIQPNDTTPAFDLAPTTDNTIEDTEDSEDESTIEDYKQEVYEMALNSLRSIKAHVKGILNAAVEDMDIEVQNNLTEPWLQGKIAVVADYVQNIHDFVMFSKEDDDTLSVGSKKKRHPRLIKSLPILRTTTNPEKNEEPEQSEEPHQPQSDEDDVTVVSPSPTISADKPGLWDNIRKKKEREGKNYRPAKPGDKDRPAPDQWKKLTK